MPEVQLNLGDHCQRTLELGTEDSIAPLFSDEWLGSELWPAAHALVRILEGDAWRRRLRESSLVCELGSGTGVCGLAAAALGAPAVLLTDKPALISCCETNISANKLADRVSAEALTWTEACLPATTIPQGADLVLMSDCLNPIYGDEHAAALASTLHCILSRASSSSGATPLGLLSQTRRGKGLAEAIFFKACVRLGLTVRPLDGAGACTPGSLGGAGGAGGSDTTADTGSGPTGLEGLDEVHVYAIEPATLPTPARTSAPLRMDPTWIQSSPTDHLQTLTPCADVDLDVGLASSSEVQATLASSSDLSASYP